MARQGNLMRQQCLASQRGVRPVSGCDPPASGRCVAGPGERAALRFGSASRYNPAMFSHNRRQFLAAPALTLLARRLRALPLTDIKLCILTGEIDDDVL